MFLSDTLTVLSSDWSLDSAPALFLSDTLTVLSSAKKPTEQCLIDKGRSLIKSKNNVGPKIDDP